MTTASTEATSYTSATTATATWEPASTASYDR
jgi:hypothetical protein